jgi:O-acetyl-ADP-ribose deacetylase
MGVELVEGDITTRQVDAIVNAANSSLLGGGGVDGAIHRAGGPAILAECRELRKTRYPQGLPTGEAVATAAGDLPARWVIHTVGPIYDGDDSKGALLSDAYTSSLTVAAEIGARSVAFPLISAGVYGWPKDDAVRRALTALTAAEGFETLELVLYGRSSYDLAARILSEF